LTKSYKLTKNGVDYDKTSNNSFVPNKCQVMYTGRGSS